MGWISARLRARRLKRLERDLCDLLSPFTRESRIQDRIKQLAREAARAETKDARRPATAKRR